MDLYNFGVQNIQTARHSRVSDTQWSRGKNEEGPQNAAFLPGHKHAGLGAKVE